MILYLWVALGSAIGGAARYGLGDLAARLWGPAFPWGTLVINVLGSFVIGAFSGLTGPAGAVTASPALRVFVMVGLCGGFTTFSAFSLQTVTLVREGRPAAALANIGLSVVLCLGATALGLSASGRLRL